MLLRDRKHARLELGAVLVITLLGALLRVHHLGQKSLWLDEIINAGSSFADNVLGWGQEPLHIAATHLSMALFGGRSEFVVRLPSVMAGILCVPAMYRLGKSCFSRVEGLVGACLLAISPLHLSHSQEARHYAFFTLFSILSLLLYDQMLRGESNRAWIGFVLASSLNLLTHKFALFLLLAQVLVAPVLSVRRSGDNESARKLALNKGLVRELGLALAFTAVLYLPSVLVTWRRVLERGLFSSTGSLPLRTSLSLSFLVRLLATLGAGPGVALKLYLGALLLGLAFCVLEHRRIAALFVVSIAMPPLLYSLWRPDLAFNPRYMIFVLPVYLLLIARGIAESSARLARLACSRLVPSSSAAIGSTALTLLIVVVFGLASIDPLRAWYETPREDWRGVADYLKEHAGRGDVLLCDGVHHGHGGDSTRTQRGLRYYLDSDYPRDLILRETEIPRTMEELGDEPGQAWGVVFTGSYALKSAGREGVMITDFQDIALVRVREPGETVRENSVSLMEALIGLMPRPEAVADLAWAVEELHGQQAEARMALGNAHLQQGRTVAAESEYRRAIELDPEWAGPHVRLADAYRAEGRFEEAIQEYHRALELKPAWDQEVWFHMRLASVYRETGWLEEAVREYQTVLEMDPHHVGATKWLSELTEP